jgi:LacI family gluconate utilization system Gnt-I transcriptional repressor
MSEVGYIRNRMAGSLTAGRSRLVAAIVPTLRHSLFAETLEGLSDVLGHEGFDLIVTSSLYRSDVEENHIRALLESRPDAARAHWAHSHERRAAPARFDWNSRRGNLGEQ